MKLSGKLGDHWSKIKLRANNFVDKIGYATAIGGLPIEAISDFVNSTIINDPTQYEKIIEATNMLGNVSLATLTTLVMTELINVLSITNNNANYHRELKKELVKQYTLESID